MAFKMAATVAVVAVLVTLTPAVSFGDAAEKELVDLISQLRSQLAKTETLRTQHDHDHGVPHRLDTESIKKPPSSEISTGAQSPTYASKAEPPPVNPSQNLQHGLTDGQKQRLLYLLNKYRAEARASNMHKLVWNDQLARIGQEWSDRCVFEHRSLSSPGGHGYVDPADVGFATTTLGENIWAFSDNSQVVPDAAVKAWDDEKNHYNFATATCQPGKDCGHYIANMWAHTRAVGCGFTKCASVHAPGAVWPGGVMISCNFAGGADMDKQPFKLGQPCTECSSGKLFCTNNLCDDTCTSTGSGGVCQCQAHCKHGTFQSKNCSCQCQPGYMGGQCDDTCRNLAPECDGDWAFTDCDADLLSMFGFSFMYDKMVYSCPQMCRRCVGGSRKASSNSGRYQDRSSDEEHAAPAHGFAEIPPTTTAAPFGHKAGRNSGRYQDRSSDEEHAVTEVPVVTDAPVSADPLGHGQAHADPLAPAVHKLISQYFRSRHQVRDD